MKVEGFRKVFFLNVCQKRLGTQNVDCNQKCHKHVTNAPKGIGLA